LAALHAGVPAKLFPVADRLRMLRAYRKVHRTGLRFGFHAKAVNAAGKRRTKRSSSPSVPQPLVWVAGEEVVAIPEIAANWQTPALGEPFYSPAPPGRERVTLPGG